MKHIVFCLCMMIFCPLLKANNLVISDVIYDQAANTLTFDVAWDNGFRTELGVEDLVFIFIKYRNSNDPNWYTMPVPVSGHTLNVSGSIATIEVASTSFRTANSERVGIEIGHGNSFQSGPTDVTATVALSGFVGLLNPSFKVFGLEMVRSSSVAIQDYYIGDGSSNNRFCAGNEPSAPFFLDASEFSTSITVGNGAGDINTTSATPLPVSSISIGYLRTNNKCMRYEITQKQYVDFLNCLSRTAQNNRTWTDVSGTSVTNRYVMSASFSMVNRNGIKCDATLPEHGPITFYCDLDEDDIPNESNDGQSIAANYLSPGDLMAYLDWAGLEPMNEINYEFFARGPAFPIQNEYAWASTVKTAATLNIAQSGGENETPTNIGADGLYRRSNDPMRTGACATPTSNRIQAGASYSGIMDLSGNVAELVIGSYSTEDFASLTKGDGQLDIQGNADENWPALLVTKGFATSNSINTVSQRHPGSFPYIGANTRLSTSGGRGIY